MAETKPRKPRARHRDVVFGAIEERILVLDLITSSDAVHQDSGMAPNLVRLRELIDELRRSLGKAEENGE